MVIKVPLYYSKPRRRKISNKVNLTKQFLNTIILKLKGNNASAICKTFRKINHPCKCVQLHFQHRNALISGTNTHHDRSNGQLEGSNKQPSMSL